MNQYLMEPKITLSVKLHMETHLSWSFYALCAPNWLSTGTSGWSGETRDACLLYDIFAPAPSFLFSDAIS